MPSKVDFAIATALFFTFIAVLIVYLISYLSSYSGLTITSELRTVAFDLYNVLFGSKGIPEDWESFIRTPVKVGLITDLYRIPFTVTETNGTNRGMTTINISVSFDFYCANKTWNSTVRILNESNLEIPIKLYNQTYCSDQFLNSSDIVFNSTFSANQNKTFFIYFSNEKSIASANYSLAFPINVSNFTIKTYPEQLLPALSVAKLKALRNLTYEEVVRTLGTEYKFKIEISDR